MNIYLTGFMGCGKSSIGKELSSALNMAVSDTDALIQESTGMNIPEIFNQKGEAGFRKIESEILRSLPDKRLVVTGGGLACSEENWNYMKQNGYIVYIKVAASVLFERLRTDENRQKRPLICKLNDKELNDYIRQMLEQREYFYRRADYVFQSPEQNLNILIEKLKTIRL